MQAPAHSTLQSLLSCLAVDPDNPMLLRNLADLALDLGDADHARLALQGLRALPPAENREDGLAWREAVLAFIEKRYDDSLVITAALLDKNVWPASLPALIHQHAMTLMKLDRFQDAATTLAPLLDGEAGKTDVPGLIPCYLRALHNAGNMMEAIEFAQRQLLHPVPDDRLDPFRDLIKGQLSLLYLDQGEFEQARTLAGETLATLPDNLDALLAGGSAAAALDDPATAHTLLQRATVLAPDNGRARLGLGLLALTGQDLDTAMREFELAVRCMPRHLGSRQALAWVQILAHRLDQAQATLEQAIGIDRNFSETWGAMAVIAALRPQGPGQQQQAEHFIRVAEGLQAASLSARFALHILERRQGHSSQDTAKLASILGNTMGPGGTTLLDLIRRTMPHTRELE